VYQLRKAALGLRKARKLQPELIKRVANWKTEVLEYDAESLASELDLIPRKPGIYIFRDATGYLYIGEAGNLRLRVAQHLDHSDRRALAHYFWEAGLSGIVVELHAFDPKSEGGSTPARRAYESDLIAKRAPRFNLRP
jgi:excinuclease UvrABC nuclease subunit